MNTIETIVEKDAHPQIAHTPSPSRKGYFSALLDTWIHTSLRSEPHLYSKARLGVAIAAIIGCSGVFVGLNLLLADGAYIAGASILLNSFVAGISLLLMRSGKYRQSAILLALGMELSYCASVATTGGVASAFAFWLPFPTLIATLVLNRRAGLMFASATVGFIVLLILGERWFGTTLHLFDMRITIGQDPGSLPISIAVMFVFIALADSAIENAFLTTQSAQNETLQALAQAESLANEVEQEKIATQEALQKIDAFAKYLAGSVEKMQHSMKQFAEGDLSVQLDADGHDDIARLSGSINHAIIGMRTTVEQVLQAFTESVRYSERIRQEVQDVRHRAEEQALRTAQIASTMEEMTATIEETSNQAANAMYRAAEAHEEARRSGAIIATATASMHGIAQAVEEAVASIEELGNSSNTIGVISQTIDEIADQTNLLALNAAIEAARAGNAGRGFAVVADEIRKLAERTQKATKEISVMVKDIQNGTTRVTASMRDGQRKVEEGVQASSQAMKALETIIDHANTVSETISLVSAANTQQSVSTLETTRNLHSIHSLTEATSSGVGSIASALDEIIRLSDIAQSRLLQFKLPEVSSNEMLDAPKAQRLQAFSRLSSRRLLPSV